MCWLKTITTLPSMATSSVTTYRNCCRRHHRYKSIDMWTQLVIIVCLYQLMTCITHEERIQLRDESREMFFHAYDSYIRYAFPADELMPLSCRGRYRDSHGVANRGDVDDALGNFSLTLVDTLDSLVIFGNYSEFEVSVKRVVRDVHFDTDVVVSVFETNIRMVGGLISAHILAELLNQKYQLMAWYSGQLLELAKDLGYRLLPAFNTTTGIPHPRINLKYGLKSDNLGFARETCTSCAGTMILEFAALSRLTGDPVFELKARKAMDYLWRQRHRQSDLVGNVINIHTGDWIRRESGVGAGIDSYYEYCLKAYILLGDESYLERFNRHYAGVMKYVSQGPLLVDVMMHRPHSQAKNFMDSLLAFWPGLQVLKGDLKPAIETHEMLYQVMKKHRFLPEAFTTDFTVHWAHHPLRPEFLESTYFLFKATGDPHYLEVGKQVLRTLQEYARVECGFASVKDVRTGGHEDRMDSFVLAETLKYLYLLFAYKEDIELDLDEFVFTTEAHLLPLSLANINITGSKTSQSIKMQTFLSYSDDRYGRECPNTRLLLGKHYGLNYGNNIRTNMKNFVDNSSKSPNIKQPIARSKNLRYPKLKASEFSATNSEHLDIVRQMGITVVVLADGRVQLVHNSAAAASVEDAEDGTQFMQEMIALSKQQLLQNEQKLRSISFTLPKSSSSDLMIKMVLSAGPAQFGLDLGNIDDSIDGNIVLMDPLNACKWPLKNGLQVNGKIAVVERGDCMFVDKARNVQKAGGIAVIVIDNVVNSSSKTSPMFAMSGDGHDDVDIAVLFVYWEDGQILRAAIEQHPHLIVSLSVQSGNTSETQRFVGVDDESDTDIELINSDSSGDNSGTNAIKGVAHVRDITDDVLSVSSSPEAIDIDKLLNVLNVDISNKYADYVNNKFKTLDNKIVEDIWDSVFKSTVKTMQDVMTKHQYKNVDPIVRQVFRASQTLSDVKKTINHLIEFLNDDKLNSRFGVCSNPLVNVMAFKKWLIDAHISPSMSLL
ncbi:ER degradation-enhancing alpha-mannosidase-like protein 3 [Oppia nitens]|uniref:ER degradation-enhancing alpha-mannosidase-like protein 3 n=1 Tax=Oppia nitens TaxID=1686743 RepID=UPI0023DBBFD2|nr:ER degradation-enhancing alpha-mannosidase-like protein 3 [Oppia nitens]